MDIAPFYGFVSRAFAVQMGSLSKGAARVYAYMRTWCFGDLGRPSEWRQLRAKKIADDLNWSLRYIRRCLAELRDRKLLESQERFVTLPDGTRAQDANVWRVLPAEGETMSETETKTETKTSPKKIDREVASVASMALDAIPGWLTAALEEAYEEIDNSKALLEGLETPPAHLTELWTPTERAERAARQRIHIREVEAAAADLQRLEGRPASEIVVHPAAFRAFLTLTREALIERALKRGQRRRSIQRAFEPATVERQAREYLASIGVSPPE